MALPVTNGTAIFLGRRWQGFTPHNFPSSSKLKHCQICNSGYNDTTRLFSVSSAANVKIAVIEVQQKQEDSLTLGWAEFSKNVSGEWDGFGADFTRDGLPVELPESVVPEAYKEWEVKVFDWQTQCPTLAQPTHFDLIYKVIRLLPTVGCEADAATRYRIDERNLSEAVAFAYRPNGCYVAVWAVAEKAGGVGALLELEHCLVDPRDRESRVRIIQVVGVDVKGELELVGIEVFCEQWYGPFRNGDQLGGCAIRDSAFAATKATESLKVSGVWQGINAIASFKEHDDDDDQKKVIRELVDENIIRKSARDGSGLTLLPKQLWCSIDHEEEKTCCQVGWLLDQGLAITSRCFFSTGGKLKEIAMASESLE
ncbi:hypothetical protein M9H77_31432 [Catharanthus roseus]|uniref:Uncharacterized protein n=1 Tax=Catharanthus roseus TaxID=4058 RepID=A0ACC0A1Y5_CATRO|nr:hypothetical protein M9H77_31432 [Catharanthus roseus]